MVQLEKGLPLLSVKTTPRTCRHFDPYSKSKEMNVSKVKLNCGLKLKSRILSQEK